MAEKIIISDNFSPHKYSNITYQNSMNQRKKRKQVTVVYMWIGPINVETRNNLLRELLFLLPCMPVDLMCISIS